jgi:hypothetical protein
MAGQIVVSSIKTDSDNSISFLANTGATIFSANLASGLSASSFGNNTITSDKIVSVANTKISGNIVSSQITSVANTQLTGTVTNAQLGTGAVSNTKIASGAVEQYFADTGYNAQFRNRIINGDMRIAQRGNTAVTTTGSFPVDRFFVQEDTDGDFSAQQDSSAPTGFVNSTKLTTTTADASLGATQYYIFRHKIEGFNTSDLMWGTANAKTVTLSFWVRSSLTGTFGGVISNSAQNRIYPYTYTISAADTWEQKSVTIAGDTTGTWLTTNGTGLDLIYGLGVGTDYSGTAGSWSGTFALSTTGAVSVIGTLNATWYITGVQLEVGSVATPFERRPYGAEFDLCRRYYERFSGSNAFICTSAAFNTNDIYGGLNYYEKRATPTFTAVGGSNTFTVYGNNASVGRQASDLAFQDFNLKNVRVGTGAGGYTTGYAYFLQVASGSSAYIEVSSEL